MSRLLAVFVIVATLTACESQKERDFAKSEAWKRQLLHDITGATIRMYQCTDEIYKTLRKGRELAVCQDACKQYDVLHETELHQPSYVQWSEGHMPGPAIERGEFCDGVLAQQTREGSE